MKKVFVISLKATAKGSWVCVSPTPFIPIKPGIYFWAGDIANKGTIILECTEDELDTEHMLDINGNPMFTENNNNPVIRLGIKAVNIPCTVLPKAVNVPTMTA